MARLDVTFVCLSDEVRDVFEVVRRGEVVSRHGRAEIADAPTIRAFGALYPTGDNSLVRKKDYEHGVKTMTVVTPFRLRMAAPEYLPDLVLYRGNTFIVSNVKDYTHMGQGFVEAEITSLPAQDIPPQ